MNDTQTLEPTEAPHPDLYLPEQLYTGPQDDDVRPVPVDLEALGFARTAPAHQMAPRDWPAALDWWVAQSAHRSKDWTGRCQEACRTSVGAPGGAASALDAFFGAPAEARVLLDRPEDAVTGMLLVSRGRNQDTLSARFGHIIYVARPFADHRQGAWSTDALRTGWPDKINPSDLYARWGHDFLGALLWENGLWLNLRTPAPVQDQKYLALQEAYIAAEVVLRKMRVARDTAKEHNDVRDRARIVKLIARQAAVRHDTRAAFDEMRHAA